MFHLTFEQLEQREVCSANPTCAASYPPDFHVLAGLTHNQHTDGFRSLMANPAPEAVQLLPSTEHDNLF